MGAERRAHQDKGDAVLAQVLVLDRAKGAAAVGATGAAHALVGQRHGLLLLPAAVIPAATKSCVAQSLWKLGTKCLQGLSYQCRVMHSVMPQSPGRAVHVALPRKTPRASNTILTLCMQHPCMGVMTALTLTMPEGSQLQGHLGLCARLRGRAWTGFCR